MSAGSRASEVAFACQSGRDRLLAGGRVWLVGVALGGAYADEGKLLGQWVGVYGRGGLAAGTLMVGDRLYGYGARNDTEFWHK